MTRVADVRIDRYRVPFVRPVRTAGRAWREATGRLVTLIDAAGRRGLGEAPDPVDGADIDVAALARSLIGLEVMRPASIEIRRARLAAEPGVGPSLAGAIASAAWDLRARAEARPLSAVLARDGGDAPAATVSVNALVEAGPPAEAAADARRAVAAGQAALKVKVGDEPAAAALERLRAVRAAIGPSIELRIDANGGIVAAELPAFLTGLTAIAPAYVEDPLPTSTDLAVAAALRRASPVRFAFDEPVRDRPSAAAIIAAEAADVLVLKPSRLGGLGVARAIAADARAAGLGVVVSTWFETGVGLAGALHLAASLPGPPVAHGLGTGDLLVSDLLERALGPVEGGLRVPAGPGLGVEIDERALARYAP